MNYKELHTLDGLIRREANVEADLSAEARMIEFMGGARLMRLARHVWAAYDALIDEKHLTLDELLEIASINAKGYPHRLFEDNFADVVLESAHIFGVTFR